MKAGDLPGEYLDLLNPHLLWIHFLQGTTWDHHFLLDLLTGPETCFPTYLTKYLRYLTQNWPQFCSVCKTVSEFCPLHIEKTKPCDTGHSESLSRIGDKVSLNLPLVQYSDSDSEAEADRMSDKTSESLTQDGKQCIIDRVMTVLIRLKLAVERLDDTGLFPYKAKPLLVLIEMCEELYEINE